MSCVNRSSKEFKFLAEHNDLSINALELITHKYWLENKTEDYFPSDVYIQAQLGKIPYEEPSKAVRDLWKRKYEKPQEYKSLESLQEARQEALRFFPEEAITYHTNFKGNYVLTIRKPLARMSLSISSLTGRETYDGQEKADFDLVVKALSKEQGKNITVNNAKENLISNPLKRQYRGKLIYAQAGTGKSTIADNIDVFDSDFLLGQILGVSPETAGFFFKTLDSQQKTAFGEKYRELIRQKIAEGKTVLTANASMLNEADVVMYNESAELTDKRVNAKDRAINNQYSALDYHKDTLEQINQLRNNEKGKEYIKLDGDHYISDYLLTNPVDINSKSLEGTDGTRPRGVEDQQTLINNFLSAFDISVNHLDGYNSKLPLFDALNRTINAQSPEEITEGVGYAIAFMMQSDPEMQKIIMQSHGLEGNYTTKVRDPRKAFRVRTSMGQMTRMLLHKEDVIKETGKQITEELRKHFGEDIDKVKTENKSIWNIIKSFFNKLNWALFRNIAAKGNVSKASRLRKEALAKEGLFVADIVDALGRGDFSRIKGPMIKPGTMEKAQRVVIGKALKENPFEDSIIRKLGSKGISLAGSASIAVEGTLFRPLENPLHDIDFNAGDNSSRKTVDKVMGELFKEGTWSHSTSIANPLNPKNSTQTYVLLNVPFTTKNVRDKGFYAEYYSQDGKYLGKRVKSELYLENGVQGKLLDFFVGPKAASKHGTHFEDFNGHRYLFSNSNAAMAAKILWARPKDMWDYKNFRRERETQDNFDELQMSIASKGSVNNSEAQIQQEMADIKAKAIANGTFMKAPNGKDTNLTERQWLQVRTKNFINWFGDWINDPANASKVVDENGEPLVVYHGGARNINAFKLPNNKAKISFDDTRNLKWAKREGYVISEENLVRYNNGEEVEVTKPVGVYFAADEVVSRSYFGRRNIEDDGLYATFLNIRNPYITNKEGKQMPDDAATVEDLQKAKDNNQDGVIIENVRDYGPNDEERMNWETNEFATHPTTDYIVFTPNQIKSATDNNGEFSTENDDIQMSISSPQTFTFKDGTTVKAPFKPNYQQVDALNAMDEFIKSNRTSMTLSGYAGTGKTSLMEMLAEKMNKQYRPIMFCASTNKAAAVLKERVSKAGFDASTLNTIFGITVEVDPNKSYNARNLVNKLKDPKIPAGTTVVIDEASMINEENYAILNRIAKENGLKIIYVGDAAQLAPVNETKISKVFRDQNHEVRTLSIVERTGDNAILKEATSLREGEALSGESSFNSKGQGVAYLRASNTQEKEAIIKRFIPELKNNPNYFRILAYTNVAVANYNAQVRNLLGYNDNIPRVGEPITGYANWGYVRNRDGSSSYKFINSEAYKVVAVQQPKTVTKDLPKVGVVSLQVIPITLENSLGEKRDYNLIDIKGNQENRAVAFRLAKAKAELHNTANRLGGRAQIPYRQAANVIEEFLFVNDTLGEKINGDDVTYQAKVFDFGYAMTVHKSQGSTFTHVLMDDVDINRAKDERNSGIGLKDIPLNWEDVATEEPVTYEVAGPMEDVDMGDWENETPSTEGTPIQEAPKTENPDAANIRQQLKYVAVSRATDTVTIISDNVKKEDTPLNHINEAPVSEVTASENKPVEQMSSKEVWRYLSALQPTTKRVQVEYTPKGQARQTYTVENGHIYNSKGTEVYPGKTVHKNMVLANYAVQEGLAVVVKHPTSGEKYVVDNNQQIISVRTGKIMEWGEENGDKRKILAQAEKEFRERIAAAKERGSALNEQMLDQLQLIGLDLHYEDEMAQYLKEHRNKAIQQAMQTPEGEIRGFATPEGSLYLDRTAISPEHPIHEYTHLWDRVVAKNNPELWHRGIALMKQISLWKNIENDTNYGKKWKALKGMTPQKLESLIASEVHSRLVGVNGEQILDRLSKEKGQKGIIGRLKQWLLDFWKDLKATFSNWSQEDLDKLTLQDFIMMTIRDFVDGFNPNTFQQASQQPTQQQNVPTSYEGMITPDANTIFVFGSNPEGRHGAGAAKVAREKFGAVYGQGEGLQGNAYALPTKDLRVKEDRNFRSISPIQITENIRKMYEVARQNPSKQFKVAYTNGLNEVTLNGYTGAEMIKMFKDAGPIPSNVVFSKVWTDHWNEVQSEQQQAIQQEKQKLDALKQDLGGGEQATAEVQDAVKVAKKGMSFEEALAGQEAFFSKEEQAQIKQGLNGKNLQVMSVSRLTDPAFFSKEIVSFLEKNAEKPLNDPTRVTAIEIWSKHDGLPIKDILDACKKYRVAPIVSFSITGLGGTALEGGVMKYQDMLKKVGELIKNGTLNPATTTVRIDPILPGVTNMDDIRKIVETAKSYGIKKFVTSLVQSYGYTEGTSRDRKVVSGINNALATEGKTYDWDKYYGRDRNGKINFKPKQEVINEIGKVLLELDKDPEITIQTCAFGINGLKVSACLDPMIIERITGVDVLRKDGTYDRDTSRPECMCYGCHGDFFKGQNKKCYSSCAYCYAAHSGDNKLNYYNEDGTLKDNDYTRTTREKPLDTSAIFNNPSSSEVTVEDKMKPWRSDPSKQNTSRRIYLKGHKDKGYFEVVKDFEDGYYSVHFKPTDSDNPNAFSKDEKEVLFRAVADTIPVDGKLSTWGELSRGGIAGLERFSKLGFAQSGERTVTMKGTGEEVTIPVFTKYPDTTARVSLKGYEYFTEASEDTLVDASWKIPLLQELDRQFSTENPEGRNEEILQQMKDILDAKSFEEWQNNTDSETKEKVQKNLDEYEQLIGQLNNLLDSNIITASEVRHVAELVVNAISDNLTQLQKEKGLAEQQFPTLNSSLDFQTASRKDIITAIGINKLVYRAKLLFDPKNNNYKDRTTLRQAKLIMENWDAIMTLASDIFAANEGVGISRDFDNGGWHSVNGQKIDFDNFNDYENDPDAMAEETKDEQEHWQIEQRTIDILNSMSAMVRLALHECYQVDKEGNVIKSKWGIPERVNARNAVNSILRWTQGALSLEDMITKLSAKQGQHPWLGQLIERLNDKTGNETDFQSQFYGVFAKHFQLYSVVLLEDGKYHSMAVNSHPALTEAMQTITTQFRVGEHPLFTSSGINKKLLGTNSTVGKDAEFNLHKALAEMRLLSDRINHGEDVDADMAETATNNIMGAYRVLGYPVAEGMVSEIVNSDNILYLTEKLGFIVDNLDKAAKANKKDYDPFAYKKENSIGGSLRNFLTPITDQLEDTATNAFYDSGKMYQSYVTPSFMTKLLQKFRLEGQDFEDFLDSEYGNSEWFKFRGRNGTWRNEWLRMLATNEEARKIFDHKVELNFNKHNYMRNMSDAEYTLSLFAEYFAEGTNDKQAMVPAWFRIPMQSNKPSSEFIKFYSYRGVDYKNDIRDGLYNMFLQELSRIQTVRMRNLPKNHPSFIKNFDKNGKLFNFLPFFNSYLEDTAAAKKGRNLLDTTDSVDENTDFAKILQKKLRGDELTSGEETSLMEYAKKAIYNHMDRRAQEILNRWEQEGILEAAKQVEGVGKEDADVRNSIENYLWNDAFAAKNILQLTVGDIAFYKDAEDLQKRLAQLHAPGTRGNINATDYQGNRVSDGYYRTFILQDFDTFRSNIIANITEVFDRKIARAPKSQKAQLEALKDSLVRPPKTNGSDDKGGKYWNINVTDAQGYSSPSSYRKKAFIFGKWSHKAEDIYQKLLSGEYNYTDLEVAFQPLKPFVYTHLEKHIGDGTPIETMNVPFQAKNSEYLLIMADAIIQSEVKESGELSRPNILRAIYRVMEDSERLNPTKGIDTVQFESAIKSGLQGKINIHQFAEDVGGESLAYNEMMGQIYQNYDKNKPLEEQQLQYNTDTFVHEASFEDYCLQQEVPEHFKDHSQAHGSQIRMITPSDLDLYKDPNGDPNDVNNINYYEWTEPDGTKRKVRADEFKKEYEQTIADNIAESINNLAQELHLDSIDKKERNIALSKILLREILSSPRYGVDLAQACAVDKATGEFRIPKGDPIQAKRIEQLINSIIKNRVNKQKIAGGPIVQVTNFGTSKQLHIRFNTKSGELLKMEDEFTPDEKYKTYDEYKKAEQAGIAYFEVFVPIWANEIFEKFANEDGTIDVKAIEAVDPDLLKMISYRIPTEDKYSCAPMKVVGFMPREAGDAIMLPYELTEIDDSDFDVDKRYVMRKDIKIKENKSAIEKLLIKRVSESYANAHNGKVNKKFIIDQVKMYMDNPDIMKIADALMASIHREKQLIMKQHKDKVYRTVKHTSGRTYRDNKIVDMTWAVLTNEMTADKILNPGGFDNFKRVGYMAAAYRLKSHEMSWSQLQGKTTDELNDLCYVDKDLTWADTQIQFYKQNAAAASLIGVFAVNKVAHATLEGDDIYLDISEVINSEEPFTIGGTVFGGRRDTNGNPLMTEEEYDEWITILPGFKKKDMSYEEYLLLNEDTSQRNRMQVDLKYDREGNLIGKTLGSGVSASADAAKTPVLNLLNINMTTVGTFTSLLRLGMPHEDACMFIGQDVIARILDDFNRQNLIGYASLNSVITKEIDRLREKYDITEDSAIDKEPLTKEELIEGLTPDEHEVIDYKVLIAFQKAKAIADSMRKLSFPTRFNSISSAVGPLIIDNLILEHKMEQFMDENGDTHFYTADGVNVDITDVFADHPVLNQFSRTVGIARQMTSDMPAGSTGFRNMLAQLPEDIKEKIYNDKKMFSKLSDFYQSYLAIASGLINPANLKSYIDGFPKWFMKQDFKEKYPDNALIQAIQMTVSKKTGRSFLNIKLTGEDETIKETYRNAWIDLHKTDPDLSQKLFEYCFFRAGIGFSPKTFMAVVPAYVKERLQRKLSNGETTTYLDTYRRFPSIPNEVMIDQFVANNWEDKKLVPKKGGKNSHFTIKGTELYATTQEDIQELEGASYIKVYYKGETRLYKLVTSDETGVHYTELKPLGNNGEYLEMSLGRINTPMSKTTQTSENNDASEIKETSASETDAAEEKAEPLTTENKRAKAIAALARDFMKYNETSFGRQIKESKANAQAEDMVNHPERYGSLMQSMLKAKGIEMSKEDAIKKLKDLDLC